MLTLVALGSSLEHKGINMSDAGKKFKEAKSQLKDVEGKLVSANVVLDDGGCAHVVASETDKVILELLDRIEALEAEVKQLKDKP